MTVRPTAQFSCRNSLADCLRQMDLAIPPPRREVTLDLTDLAFIDPVGLVSLWAWKNRVEATCRRFAITRPRSADVLKYLEVMDFFNPTPQNTGSQISWGSSGMYFPIHHLQTPGVGVVENLASEIATTFGDHVPGTTSALAFCFQEAIDNVFQHAESPVGAVAAAQLLPHTPRRWCQASIADRGVSVLGSLRRSPDHAALTSDEQALRLAIQRYVTSTAPHIGMYGGSRPGMGLYMISEVCRRTGGELMLLSGDTLLHVQRGGETVENVPRWHGTILTVRLSANALDAAGDVISEIRRSLRGPAPEGLARFED